MAFSCSVPLFGKKASIAEPELRRTKSGDAAWVRWRIRSAAAVSEHKSLFQSHGMKGDGKNGHSLETVAMAVLAAQEMIRNMQSILATGDSFIDKYEACYAVMQPAMTEVAGKSFPKVSVFKNPTDSMLARPKWQMRSDEKVGVTLTGSWTHIVPLQIMVDEVNAQLETFASIEACHACVKDFVARQRQTAQVVLHQEIGKSSVSLEASKRASKLHDAQAAMLTKNMLAGIKITDLLQPTASRNTFTGFKNFAQYSCYLNVLLQLFCHTDFVAIWMQENPHADRDFTTCLADILRLHGAFECVAPFEFLGKVLAAFENYGICTNSQNDALELLFLIREHLMVNPRHSEQMACVWSHEVALDVSPDNNRVKTLEAYLHESFAAGQHNFSPPPRRLLLSKIPVYGETSLDVKWIHYECSGWDAVLDMNLLMAPVVKGEIRYRAKAAIFHVHRLQDRAVMTSGHYVMMVKQGDNWHLCNDEVVRAVDLQTTPYPPCCVYLERLDAMADTKPCLPDASVKLYTWQQILVGIEQASAASAVGSQPSQHPGQERKSSKAQASQSKNQPSLTRWFSAGDRSQDQSGRQQDKSGQQQQDRSGQRQQDRSGRQQDRSGQQQDRSGRQQDSSGRQGEDPERNERISARASSQAAANCKMLRVDPLNLEHTPVQLFAKQYNLQPRTGLDEQLREFTDEPTPLPPVSCLLQGCANVWMNNLEEFKQHCDQVHGGEQAYRLRCLHLLSRHVWQVKGSLQRAALQNFAEFQVRSETQWTNFAPHARAVKFQHR